MTISVPGRGVAGAGLAPTVPAASFAVGAAYRGDTSLFRAAPGVVTGRVADGAGGYEMRVGLGADLSPEMFSSDHTVEVAQVLDLTDYDAVTFAGTLDTSSIAGGAATWVVTILVDDVALGSVTTALDRERSLLDVRAPVARYTGPHAVALRLSYA